MYRFMRIFVALMILGCLQATARGFSQQVTISARNISPEQVIQLLRKQTGWQFWYDYDQLKKAKPVDISVKNATVSEVLNKVLDRQLFSYTIEGNIVVIRESQSIGPMPPAQQDSVIISGHVFSDLGDPLSGAIILLKGTKKAAMANAAGEFTIRLDRIEARNGTLVFTYVGYNKREYRISGHKTIDITLERNIQELNNVVVTNAYSKPRRKEEVTGSIVSVSSEELQVTRPIESLDKMLEGLAAGVQVEPSTELGTPVKINIRGQNSLTNLFGSNRTQLTTSSQPLYIIDGVPVMEQRRGDEPIAFLNNEQLLNPLAGINPDDIETISVLKDAAAASIYGANASNGVIIITTKKGRAGKTRLNIGYNSGWSQSINKMKWLSGPQYYELLKEMYINDGRSAFDAELLSGASDINTPWFELVNQYGNFRNADIDISGGSDRTQFRISGSWLDQESIQKGNDFRKFYFRLRLDHHIKDKLRLGVTLAPSFTEKNAINTFGIVPLPPNIPSYNADGSFYKLNNLGVPNPLAVIAQNVNNHKGGTLNGNIKLEYEIFKNLRIYTSLGTDILVNKLNIFESPRNATGESKNGSAEIYDRTNFSWISSTQLNWSPVLKKDHKFDIITGFEAQSQQTFLLRGQGSGFSYYRLNELSNAENQSSSSSKQTANSYSVYGQALYNYKGRYFASLSGRYDAASIFGTDVNATVNGAAGIGWLINKEKFLEDKDWLDMLRIRASYGTTGNSRIGSYEARGLYTFSTSGYNGQTSANMQTAPNPNLSWEKNYKTNLGFDFGFLKRFNIALDLYQHIVDDAISPISTPTENGFTTTLVNIAKMRNRGIDLSLQAQILTGTLTWNSTFNLGYNRNIVLEVKNNTTRYASSNEQAALLKAGVSTSAIWGFRFAGVDPTTGFEQYYDNTGKVVPAAELDRTLQSAYYLGDRLPDAQGGWVNSLGYKGLTLTFNIIYSVGSERLINYLNENNGRNLNNRNQSVNLLDRWQQPGDITQIPRLSSGISGQGNPIVSNSSRYLYNDTHIKLSNVSIAYRLPRKITDRLKGINITVFGNGTNLFYWYQNDSPSGRNGIREYKFAFPEAQSFTAGFKLSM